RSAHGRKDGEQISQLVHDFTFRSHDPCQPDTALRYFFSPSVFLGALGMVISTFAGATPPSFQSEKDNRTNALPLPASVGTPTGPWKRTPQHRLESVNFRKSRPPPASLWGKSISAKG